MEYQVHRITKLLAVFFTFALFSLATFAQTTKHVIKAGETLYSISRTYDVTVSAIQAANPGLGEKILTGQTIYIPA